MCNGCNNRSKLLFALCSLHCTAAVIVAASERFDKAGLLAAHLAALHNAFTLERGLLPGSPLPDSEAPPITLSPNRKNSS